MQYSVEDYYSIIPYGKGYYGFNKLGILVWYNNSYISDCIHMPENHGVQFINTIPLPRPNYIPHDNEWRMYSYVDELLVKMIMSSPAELNVKIALLSRFTQFSTPFIIGSNYEVRFGGFLYDIDREKYVLPQ